MSTNDELTKQAAAIVLDIELKAKTSQAAADVNTFRVALDGLGYAPNPDMPTNYMPRIKAMAEEVCDLRTYKNQDAPKFLKFAKEDGRVEGYDAARASTRDAVAQLEHDLRVVDANLATERERVATLEKHLAAGKHTSEARLTSLRLAEEENTALRKLVDTERRAHQKTRGELAAGKLAVGARNPLECGFHDGRKGSKAVP